MENNNPLTKKLDTSKLLLLLIAFSILGVGVFIGVFISLGKSSDKVDPLTKIEIARSNADSSALIKNNSSSDIVLNSKVKTWHYDAGRIIGPTINLLASRPSSDNLYPSYCNDIKSRTTSLLALNVPPASDVASAWGTWLKSLKDIAPLCERKDWNGVSLKVTTSGSYFDTFYKTVARYDSTLLVAKSNQLPVAGATKK